MKDWLNLYNFLIYDSIDSTNTEARRLYNSGIRNNLVIWAKNQTLGRGRDDKKWYSPEGNLYITIVLNQHLAISQATNFSFLTAVALAEAIDFFTNSGLNLKLKWPNDLLLDEKKLAGILLESIEISEQKYINSLIIGIGCNLLYYPENTHYRATSLKEAGYDIKPEDFLDKFIELFDHNKSLLESEGFIIIKDKWMSRAYGFQQTVTIKTNNSRIIGSFEGINDEGLMIVKLSNGQNCFVNSGELFFGNETNQTVS